MPGAAGEKAVQCVPCMGSGFNTCMGCAGAGGTMLSRSRLGLDGRIEYWQERLTCGACAGSGRIVCSQCKGTGWVIR